MDKWELGKIALRLKPEIEARARANMAAGIGEQTMGKAALLAETAPQALKDALERKEVSINRGWKILKTVQRLPPEEQKSAAAEMLSAVREIDQLDAEAERRGKIASLFCKAYEKAVLLTPTVENTRMRPDEIEDSMRETYELAQTFQTIGDLLKNEVLHDCQKTVHSDRA